MKNGSSNIGTVPVIELPDSVRIPLHSLQADLGYLIGRVIADSSCGPMIIQSMRERLDQIEAYVRSSLASPVFGMAGVREALEECASRCRYDGDLFHDQGNELRRDASWKAAGMANAALATLPAPASQNSPTRPDGLGGAGDLERAFNDACDQAGCAYDNEALLESIADLKRRAAAVGEVREVLEKIVKFDQIEQKTLTEYDPAGSTYRVDTLDGYCARVARAALSYSFSENIRCDHRTTFEQILTHVIAPKRIASERLDNIEKICRDAISSLPAGGEA